MKKLSLCFMLYLAFATIAFAQGSKPAHVTCSARTDPFQLFDAKTNTSQSFEGWSVDCKITIPAKNPKDEDDVIHQERLTLDMKATFRDAMDAIEEFRTKKAPEIVKDWKARK